MMNAFKFPKKILLLQDLQHRAYRGTLHCLADAVRSEGFLSLWKGFAPYYMRVFPWQFAFFVSYEGLCKLIIGETI